MTTKCSARHWRATMHCYQSGRRFSNQLLTFTDKIIQLVHHLIHVVRDLMLARFRSSDPFLCASLQCDNQRELFLSLSLLFSRIHSAPNDCCITHDRCNTHTLIQPHPICVCRYSHSCCSLMNTLRARFPLPTPYSSSVPSSQQWRSHCLRLLSFNRFLSIVSACLLSSRIWV